MEKRNDNSPKLCISKSQQFEVVSRYWLNAETNPVCDDRIKLTHTSHMTVYSSLLKCFVRACSIGSQRMGVATMQRTLARLTTTLFVSCVQCIQSLGGSRCSVSVVSRPEEARSDGLGTRLAFSLDNISVG